jgi:hypothetical protein
MGKFKITMRVKTPAGLRRKSITRVIHADSSWGAKCIFFDAIKVPKGYYRYGSMTITEYL